MVSQKCQYSVRAIFELAKRYGKGPVKIADIAQAQAIPARFLEVILSQLKQGGFAESRRGNEGGYLLARSPRELSVADIIEFVEGPIGPVECVAEGGGEKCAQHDNCVFLPMWEEARQALEAVYRGRTFQDLVEEEERMRTGYVQTYSI